MNRMTFGNPPLSAPLHGKDSIEDGPRGCSINLLPSTDDFSGQVAPLRRSRAGR
jgi:hypothetical protein